MNNSDDDLQFRRGLEQRIERDSKQLHDRLREIEALTADVANLETRIARATDMYRLEFGDNPPVGNSPPRTAEDKEPRVTITARHRGGESWNEAVERVLREAGEPVRVNDLWDRLQADGFATGSKDPKRALATILVRHPRVVRVAPSTYALRDDVPQDAPTPMFTEEGVAVS